ncbi:MAG: YciI family protein [Acidimicrobiales bacterium]
MRYMLLIYTDREKWDALAPEETDKIMGEYFAFTQEITASGEFESGDALQPVDTATTVRVQNGDTLTTDGPFAETKEILGGFYIVNVPDLDRAVALAAKTPDAAWGLGSVEVRPIVEFPTDEEASAS